MHVKEVLNGPRVKLKCNVSESTRSSTYSFSSNIISSICPSLDWLDYVLAVGTALR